MPRGHVVPDGQAIVILRGEAGLTQDELAKLAGYGLRTIGKIENSHPTTSSTLSAVATVLSESLGRQVELSSLLSPPRTSPRETCVPSSTVIVGDQVQWLEFDDLQEATDAQHSARPCAVLMDTYTLCYLPPSLTEMGFSYFATGSAIVGRSLSHPGRAHWQLSTEPCGDGLDKADETRWATLRVGLPEELPNGANARPLVLQNRVEYFDDIGASQQPWFQTQVNYPTDCLTLVVRFPADCPGTRLLGNSRRRTSEPFLPVRQQPLELADGRTAFWRIASPTLGESYQLCWA